MIYGKQSTGGRTVGQTDRQKDTDRWANGRTEDYTDKQDHADRDKGWQATA